ncbi:MAG: glucosaminidase domain-containing protein [Spirochaetales bacterium]
MKISIRPANNSVFSCVKNYGVLCFFVTILLFLFFSCTTPPVTSTQEEISYRMPSLYISDVGIKSAESLVNFFMSEAPASDREKVERLAGLYVDEAELEGINADIAFAQMCLETGFLRFGGLVSEDMNNFCGLGAIDENQRGNSFDTEQLGVRAHIQHLKAYGTDEPLNMPLIDPRYKWVNPKGKAPTVHGLAQTWAADKDYGIKLEGILSRMAWY